MARHQISCINKSHRTDPHERIINLGGVSNGARWKESQQSIIDYIEKGIHSFYVSQAGRTVEVIVSLSRFGNKYVKTVADGVHPDNLLSLPECP